MAKVEPWIAALKVGDEVIVDNRWAVPREQVRKVEAISPTGQIRVGAAAYNPDGYQRGSSSWDRARLLPATYERVAAARHAERCLRLHRKNDWEKLSPAKVQEICAILDRPDTEQEPT